MFGPESNTFFPIIPSLSASNEGSKISDAFLGVLKSEPWLQMKDYFFSVYENTIYDLGIFAIVLLLIFIFRNVYLTHKVSRARRNIPLVVGGWGTRGKSSVERLKGALMNALGFGVLSKTTGCEAMFLHGNPFNTMREMFLFRPYDKATIWEQHNLTRLANRLNADVFLWECMALTPSYVRVLQREWMRDDISSITNTYPDHEDLQGPAGINIPEVMTNFIPRASMMITTEEQMLPILSHACKSLRTKIQKVNWLDAGLITQDILERFPYEEHPYNIALVSAFAENLGIDRDFALKEMADRVIPDIGVLKIYPPAYRKTRKLEFVSGMSANERFGALSNWKRTGFDKHDLEKDPEIWVSTVVNNRADRIPRSRVFAKILVEDIRADRHFLIGSNLTGLRGYIQESWDAYVNQLTLWPPSEGLEKEQSAEIFKNMAKQLRVPFTEHQVKSRLRAMLEGQGKDFDIENLVALWHDPETLQKRLQECELPSFADEMVSFLKNDLEHMEDYQRFLKRLEQIEVAARSKMDNEFRDLLGKWFNQKIVMIWDFHASGNQIIHRICEETPPGLYNRIMMLQNIKGTGLDFVYSWQSWERCYNACNLLNSDDTYEAEEGLRSLTAFQDYGLLSEDYVRETVEKVKHSPVAQTERFQAQLKMILSNLENAMTRISVKTSEVAGHRWYMKILELIEAFQDAGDAVRRRKKANKIYHDLVDERISHERASAELQALSKRQKGGWLLSQFVEIAQRYMKSVRNAR